MQGARKMSTQADWQLYATHSACSDPGAWGAQLDAVPGDLRSIKDAAHQLVFHYRADGDWTENGIAPERIAEIDTRFADRMLQRIFALSGAPLGAPRPPHQRLVGCCRDFTLFFVALARQKGIPARSRVGFATYFMAGWNLDHIVAEVWDAVQHRWRLVDAELRDGHVDAAGRVIDPLDVPRDRFIVGPQAWLACRAGEADPERFVVAPDLEIPETRGWPYLMHNLIHDLAALNAERARDAAVGGLGDDDAPVPAAGGSAGPAGPRRRDDDIAGQHPGGSPAPVRARRVPRAGDGDQLQPGPHRRSGAGADRQGASPQHMTRVNIRGSDPPRQAHLIRKRIPFPPVTPSSRHASSWRRSGKEARC
jgi:hypothetical protein